MASKFIKSFKRKSYFFVVACFALPGLNFSSIAAPGFNLNVQNWQTSTGVPVYFISSPEVPILDVAVVVNAGSSRDDQLPGLANITAEMLNQGQDKKTAQVIASEFDEVGALYNSSINQDMAIFTLRTLTRPEIITSAIKSFADVLTHPSFPVDAFTREKAIMMTTIQNQQQDPGTLSNQAFFQLLYGSHPYGHPVTGTLETINKINVNDINRFYHTFYNRNNISIALVGAISKQQAQKIAESLSQNFSQGKPAPAINPAPETKVNIEKISFPANQSYIRMGETGIFFNTPDYFALLLGNYILGGDMSSRLFQTVREKYGFSYSIGSYLLPMNAGGNMVIALETRTEKTQEALALTRKILQNLIQSGPTENELSAAKNFFIKSFPLRLSNNKDMLNFLVSVAYYHRPLNYIETYTNHIEAVTPLEVKQTLEDHFKINDMATVIVGSQTAHDQKS